MPLANLPVTTTVASLAQDDDVDTFHLIVMDEFRPGAAAPRQATQAPVPSPKFARVLASYCGALVTATLRLRKDKGAQSTSFGRIIGMHERIKAYTNREEETLPGDDEMITFGGELFETLLQGDVRRLYDEARTRQRDRRLDLVLTSMIPWISEKPWEFAYDVGRRSFLATEEIHFVRNVLTNVPADPVVRPRDTLRILVAAAQPVGFGRLSIEQEVEVIRRGFQALIDAKLVTLDVLPRATPAQIHGELSSKRYQIVHFIGHGVYDEKRREGCLVFVNDRGGEYTLGERALREIFCKRGLSLVFLNACESGRGGRADFNKGVAQSLVAHGLPALVANQYSVLDSSATSFAQHFYWSVAGAVGRTGRARSAHRRQLLDERRADRLGGARAQRARARHEAVRQGLHGGSTADHGARVQPLRCRQPRVAGGGVGCGRCVPVARSHTDRDEPAQSVFGFELVDVSAPLDAWDINRAEKRNYLWAERVAERLKSKAAELGVDLLACVTRHWLRDDDWFNLYGWWPDAGEPPVALLSMAGFDELAPEGPATDRAIANAMVSCLAGFHGRVGTHAGDAKNCPLAFNKSRSLRHVTGTQRFDAVCRRRLARTLGPKLKALDALLRLFDPDDNTSM